MRAKFTSDSAASHDATVIKTLRAIAAEHRTAEALPQCVCEIFDPRKVPVEEMQRRLDEMSSES